MLTFTARQIKPELIFQISLQNLLNTPSTSPKQKFKKSSRIEDYLVKSWGEKLN